LFLRLLDDEVQFSRYVKETHDIALGRLIAADNTEQELSLRDVANKIIHASDLRWDLSGTDGPILICDSQQPHKWLRAEVDMLRLAAFCGQLMS
jgi:hypothetical protein